MAAAEVPISEQLMKLAPPVRATFKATRQMVKTIAPTATEITYRSEPPRSSRTMWKIVRYAAAGANVAGIGTFPTHVDLFFYRGRELNDGSGLLKGGGKEMRFLTLQTPADADRPAIKRLVREAFKLGG